MGIKSDKKALFTEINITPLTDIFLVLLIIMMVVAPTFQSIDNSINIPEINSGNNIEQGKVTISVTQNGNLFIDGKPTEIGFLRKDLEALRNAEEEKNEVVVKADAKVKSSVIMDIMDAAQDTHYKKLIVAGEPLSKKEQKILEDKTVNHKQSVKTNNSNYDDWSE